MSNATDATPTASTATRNEVNAIAQKFNDLNPYHCGVRDLLKIEDINFIDNDPEKPQREVFGYAVSAKRYALYTWVGNDIRIVKASGHGLGFLFPPKEGYKAEADAPIWIVEAWEWLVRRELGIPCSEPEWLDLPAFVRMSLTSPNVMPHNRPDWLKPFNFFFLPMVSELGGYPAGLNCENARFVTPFSKDRSEWHRLPCINIFDGESYAMEMLPSAAQDKVVPDSFRIVLRSYLQRPEAKSLASDGTPCGPETRGLLRRASIVASEIVPVSKECDRRWEQGDDMSLVDFQVQEFRKNGKMVIADVALRDKIVAHGIRKTMRDTGLSQNAIEAVVAGMPVRRSTIGRILCFFRVSAEETESMPRSETAHSSFAANSLTQ